MNALIEGLKALRLHGMAGCAQDLLASRTPPNLTTVLKQLIEAETVERRVRSVVVQFESRRVEPSAQIVVYCDYDRKPSQTPARPRRAWQIGR